MSDGRLGDEAELVRRVLGGDREAFRLVVLRHQQALAELVVRQTGDRSGAEDMVQETFLRAFRSLASYDAGQGRLWTWLARIALNVARDHGRRREVRERAAAGPLRALERAAEPSPADGAAAAETREHVAAALASLPDAQREALVLSVYGGCSHREVAGVLGIPLGTAKTRIRAALDRLAPLVASLHATPSVARCARSARSCSWAPAAEPPPPGPSVARCAPSLAGATEQASARSLGDAGGAA